jgi:hypothetical protein
VEGLCGSLKVKNNPSKTYIRNIVKLREGSTEITETRQKAMEKMLEREIEMEHTHLERWTCASGKWAIPRHEWSSRYRIAYGWKKLEYGLVIKALKNLWSKKNRGATLFFCFYFISFSFFLSFFFFFFLFLFSFFLVIFSLFSYFFFCSS